MFKHFSGILFSLIILASCSSKMEDHDKTVFRYNEAAGISSLDPAFAKDLANIWACNQLYSGLVRLNDHLEIEPAIAKSWAVSDDGLIYTFILRNDVFFADDQVFTEGKGRRVSALDFEYSFGRIVDSEAASPGLWVFAQVENEDGNYEFEAINDTIFRIKLSQPFTPFLGILAMQYCSVVPHEAIEYYKSDFRQNPVGTGPFQLKLWKEGVKMVLVKNKNYYEQIEGEKLPYLDAVSVTFLADKQAAFLHFVQGKLDFMSGIDASYKDEILTKRGGLKSKYLNKIELISQPYLNTEYLGMLMDDSNSSNPLNIKAVRQAINYGFDRIKMMKYLRNNIGEPGLKGMIPKGFPSYNESSNYGYNYDPEKASKLLVEAGFPGGEGLQTISIATNAEYLDLCEYIQHSLGDLGINIQIDVNPPAALRELKAQSKLPFFRASWIADYPDAENYLSMFYSKNFCPSGPNYTHFKNTYFDDLYEKSLIENNSEKRYSMYSKMDSIIMDEAPVVVLYYDQVLRFVQPNIQGLGSNPINLLDLRKVRKIN
jgi:ABC-type transport system substrate-binding protein